MLGKESLASAPRINTPSANQKPKLSIQTLDGYPISYKRSEPLPSAKSDSLFEFHPLHTPTDDSAPLRFSNRRNSTDLSFIWSSIDDDRYTREDPVLGIGEGRPSHQGQRSLSKKLIQSDDDDDDFLTMFRNHSLQRTPKPSDLELQPQPINASRKPFQEQSDYPIYSRSFSAGDAISLPVKSNFDPRSELLSPSSYGFDIPQRPQASPNPSFSSLFPKPTTPSDIAPRQNYAPSGSTSLCRYYQQGFCSRGERCNFEHSGPVFGKQNSKENLDSLGYSDRGYGISSGFVSANVGSANNSGKYPAHPKLKKTSAVEEDLDIVNRFAGVMLESLAGQLFVLCQDQHGCRYLQKKLEEKNDVYTNMIFNEVYPHYVELMADPFGNYLCQRLMEFCTDEQRLLLVEAVAPHIVSISLNMHGTRAVQKMIDYLASSQTSILAKDLIQKLCNAMSVHVVTLIKDLNGNHVIQKCLSKLSAEQNQFIYNAVTESCIEVSTHRHGCCVLQRCIDHACESQKLQLVNEITYHVLTLVQDPFGNYVVQYVLDLDNERFKYCIIRRFLGNVCSLSAQKFSSNVIEKAIRVSDTEHRSLLIAELLDRERLEALLKDLYANYVIQTALDCSEPAQRNKLIDCIRPILPSIRNTPYGKRIQNRLLREPYGNDHFNVYNTSSPHGYGMMYI